MNTKGVFSHNSDEWTTPRDLFVTLDAQCHFTLDAAATKENALCKKYYTKENDGLTKSWENETVFCYPPYSNCYMWVYKACTEARYNNARVIMLLPARTDTKWFHDFVLPHGAIQFIRGRLKFGDAKNTAPFPSILVAFGFEEHGGIIYNE